MSSLKEPSLSLPDLTESDHAVQALSQHIQANEEQLEPEKSRMQSVWRSFLKFVGRESVPKDGRVRIEPRDKKRFGFISGFNILSEGNIDRFTHYLYRSSFFVNILWFIVLYFIFIVVFACIVSGIIMVYANNGKQCTSGWDYDLTGSARFGENFEISLGLSWTTLSTVGFGTISPPDKSGCAGLRWLLAFEAFFGILYAGFCGAIFYSKVSRLNARAPLVFASPVCLLYNNGITEAPMSFGDTNVDESVAINTSTTVVERETNSTVMEGGMRPYPVLDFRCVNDRLKLGGHEILHAKISCLCVTAQASQSLRDCINNKTKFVQGGYSEPLRKDYHPMKVSPTRHPFLDTVCYFRHTLDQHSPILKPSVRRRIEELGGWPTDLNDPKSIRNSFSSAVVNFVVTVCGTSNLTAESVFKLNSYTLEDIYIGWRFVGMIQLKESLRKGRITRSEAHKFFNVSYVNDIAPQNGGGSEPLGDRRERLIDANVLHFLTVSAKEE